MRCSNCDNSVGTSNNYCGKCGTKIGADTNNIWLRYVVAAFLLVAVLPMPYGYYMLLRVIVFLIFGYYFYVFRKQCLNSKKELPAWVWITGGFALLFNPFIPAHLMRPVWAVLNVAGAYLIYKTIEWEKSL